MKKQFINALAFGVLLLGLGACKKDYGPDSIGPVQDSLTDIPVTVTNQDLFERVPIIVVTGAPNSVLVTPAGTNPFSITFQIPADKGTIKEITKVQTGATGLGLLSTGTPAQAYNYDGVSATKPVTGNGSNSITFTSSLAEYRAYRARVGASAGNGGYVQPDITATNNVSIYTPQNANQLRYFFLLTLTDGTQIIPMEVRVRVLN